MSDRPLIGITADVIPKGHRRRYSVYDSYAHAVLEAGGFPIGIFPSGADQVEEVLHRVDGLLLPGGDDLHPRHWGEERVHPEATLSAEERSVFELALVREARKAGRPMFGICLGFQTVNVAFGGSILQHLEPERGHGSGQGEPAEGNEHEVLITPGTRLHAILGADRVRVNSGHHQAVQRLGEGLRISAHSTDGVPEALEGEGEPFLLGVQWHPEERPRDPVSRALLAAFLEACRRPAHAVQA